MLNGKGKLLKPAAVRKSGFGTEGRALSGNRRGSNRAGKILNVRSLGSKSLNCLQRMGGRVV